MELSNLFSTSFSNIHVFCLVFCTFFLNQVISNTFGKFQGVHPKGSIWSALKKSGRSLLTSPRLLEWVSRLTDIILCVNNLLTLLLLTIVNPIYQQINNYITLQYFFSLMLTVIFMFSLRLWWHRFLLELSCKNTRSASTANCKLPLPIYNKKPFQKLLLCNIDYGLLKLKSTYFWELSSNCKIYLIKIFFYSHFTNNSFVCGV